MAVFFPLRSSIRTCGTAADSRSVTPTAVPTGASTGPEALTTGLSGQFVYFGNSYSRSSPSIFTRWSTVTR